MWYTVKTDFDSEELAKQELKKIHGIKDVYLPYRRVKIPNISEESKNSPYLPTISGILFINISKADEESVKARLNEGGFFLDEKGKQLESKAHLLSFSLNKMTLDDRMRMAKVSTQAITVFRNLNDQKDAEQYFSNIELIGSSEYDKHAQEYDRVCILNGPYFKCQGYIKQSPKRGNEKKDRKLYIRMGDWTMVVPNIRKYNYIVVKEASKGKNIEYVNTWRYIDYLIGKLQATFFTDNAAEALRNILRFLAKGITIDDACHQILRSSLDVEDRNLKSDIALQAAFLESADEMAASCLKALGYYFKKSGDSVEKGLLTLIPDIQLRPFLTPTPGKDFPKKNAYTLLEHKDFTEIILRLDLKNIFIDEKYKFPQGCKLGKDDYVYYAHIGLKQDVEANKLTAFVNWGGYMDTYLLMEDNEQKTLKDDIVKKGYVKTTKLLNDGKTFRKSSALAGFYTNITSDNIPKLMKMLKNGEAKPLSYALIRSFYPIVTLLKLTVPAAVEIWQIPRLDNWRKLAQRYVLLHKMPITLQ